MSLKFNLKKAFFIQKILLLSLIAPCWAQNVNIKTVPEKAEVWIKSTPNDKGEKLGLTPLKTTMQDVFGKSKDGTIAFVELKLDGFISKDMVLMGQSKEVDLNLEINLDHRPEIETIKKHDLLMSKLFRAQGLIRSRNFKDALTMLDAMALDNPNLSSISELKGIAYYMSRDVEKSLSMFRKAFSQNPDNVDAFKMKVFLEKKLNIDAEGK